MKGSITLQRPRAEALGKCFNCLEPGHRYAECRRQTAPGASPAPERERGGGRGGGGGHGRGRGGGRYGRGGRGG